MSKYRLSNCADTFAGCAPVDLSPLIVILSAPSVRMAFKLLAANCKTFVWTVARDSGAYPPSTIRFVSMTFGFWCEQSVLLGSTSFSGHTNRPIELAIDMRMMTSTVKMVRKLRWCTSDLELFFSNCGSVENSSAMTSIQPPVSTIVDMASETISTVHRGMMIAWHSTINIHTMNTHSIFDRNMSSRSWQYLVSWVASLNLSVHGYRYSTRICLFELIWMFCSMHSSTVISVSVSVSDVTSVVAHSFLAASFATSLHAFS